MRTTTFNVPMTRPRCEGVAQGIDLQRIGVSYVPADVSTIRGRRMRQSKKHRRLICCTEDMLELMGYRILEGKRII